MTNPDPLDMAARHRALHQAGAGHAHYGWTINTDPPVLAAHLQRDHADPDPDEEQL